MNNSTLQTQEKRCITEPIKLIRYVENKHVDMAYIESLLGESAAANHWSNFGPLSKQLESTLASQLQVDEDLRVVACCNGTIALHALVAMAELRAEKPLRWACSSFGFYSSTNGKLSNACIVDCDSSGMLDLTKIDPNKIDGLVVTNVFGHRASLNVYQTFADAHQKILIIDSAMAFHSGGHSPNEIISLHHTKPWGFGEGGCAIVHKDHEELFRDMISFGHRSPQSPIYREATNGKISDIACAFILMRLQKMQGLKKKYLAQYRRIVQIGMSEGLSLLANAIEHPGIPANVPLLLPQALSHIEAGTIPVKKYYHPLAKTPTAESIYERIVNIPCHPDMESYDDDDLRIFFQTLFARIF